MYPSCAPKAVSPAEFIATDSGGTIPMILLKPVNVAVFSTNSLIVPVGLYTKTAVLLGVDVIRATVVPEPATGVARVP